MNSKAIGKVLESSANLIVIEISNHEIFENYKENLQIGKYLKVQNGNHDFVVGVIQNIKTTQHQTNNQIALKFVINSQPVGLLKEGKEFERGGLLLPVPTEPVFPLNEEELKILFEENATYTLPFGKLIQNDQITLFINGNNFFSKHIAIVGSTGSGKSCTVAKILQEVVGIKECENINKESQKNSHVIIFDIHSEYKAAFDIDKEQKFSLNTLNVEKLILPYWLMNSEELESIFIESNENNSHNQVSQFKKAVVLNKEVHNPTLTKINYDTPVYFNINEVFTYISNLNEEVIGKLDGEGYPKVVEGENTRLITDIEKKEYFKKKFSFVTSSTAKATKASNGPFYGEFNRFISRLETKLSDKRLRFLLHPQKGDESSYETNDFSEILKQFLGYLNKSNITIIDLSGVPFEVLSITISLISRLVFDFAFHYTKIKHNDDSLNDIPFMIVCEEAHNYVPRDNNVDYRPSRKSIERIAKEGRKYGLSLMVVSQRPSEVSETIFAQCNNFVALRLTNVNDQNYIKSLMPENSSEIANILPSLSSGECLIVGESTPLPSVIKLKMPNPAPKSESIRFHDEWKEIWKEITFEDVIKRWKKEE